MGLSNILVGMSMLADNLYDLGQNRPCEYSAIHFKDLIENQRREEEQMESEKTEQQTRWPESSILSCPVCKWQYSSAHTECPMCANTEARKRLQSTLDTQEQIRKQEKEGTKDAQV